MRKIIHIMALAALLTIAGCGGAVDGLSGRNSGTNDLLADKQTASTRNDVPGINNGSTETNRSVELSWSSLDTKADGAPIVIGGFTIHYGTDPVVYSYSKNISANDCNEAQGTVQCTATIAGLSPGTWYFSIEPHSNSNDEGVSSNELSKVVE